MFTGLIEAIGTVAERQILEGGHRISVQTHLAPELSKGDSVAVNGVCLTVGRASLDKIEVDVSPETERVSTLGQLIAGASVNLERPLRADGRLGGHFVQGHVDGTGVVEGLRAEGEFHRLTVAFPESLSPYIVQKGSIAIDGISLTVASVDGTQFDVQIVPFTWRQTNLRSLMVGSRVNLECDLIGKYVVHAVGAVGVRS